MAEPVHFSSTLTTRCQPEIAESVGQAASRRGSKPSEYVRQTVLAALRADGIDPLEAGRAA
jgi:hypothetical protein